MMGVTDLRINEIEDMLCSQLEEDLFQLLPHSILKDGYKTLVSRL